MPETLTAPETRTVFVPANRLVQSPKNARRTDKQRNIESLAASILAVGLLQNLVGFQVGDDFEVDAGERRRLAIALLVSEGSLPEDWPVPVRILDDEMRTAASAAENVEREQMHAADLFDAFHQLTVEGWTIDRIADAFSVTPLVVERYLSLAAAAPAMLGLFRTGDVTTEQLIALCATPDHELQESIWRNTSTWNRQPATLRRLALAAEIDAGTDARVAFIGGIDAYVAAGGQVRRDLFSADGQGGFIADVALLTRLVQEKLERAADEVRAEGWGWVQVWPEFDWTEYHRFGHIARKRGELTPAAAAAMDALQQEHATLAAEVDAFGEDLDVGDEIPEADAERLDALNARLEEIDAEIAAIAEAAVGYDADAMSAAGAVVSMEYGKLRIERGLVRTADRAKASEAVGTGSAVSGGREKGVGGRKGGELSDPLQRSLLGHRNLAAQVVTAKNPRVAKVLLACWTVLTIRQRLSYGVPTDLRISEMGSGTRTQHPISDDEGEVKRKAFEKIGRDLVEPLPLAEEELWDALMGLTSAKLDRLIAFGVAASVSLTRKHAGLTAKLLGALGFDMADHFVPTAANFLGRVSKAMIVDALGEAGVGGNPAGLLGLKKGDLADHAAKSLAPTRWVPALIRTPAQSIDGSRTGTADASPAIAEAPPTTAEAQPAVAEVPSAATGGADQAGTPEAAGDASAEAVAPMAEGTPAPAAAGPADTGRSGLGRARTAAKASRAKPRKAARTKKGASAAKTARPAATPSRARPRAATGEADESPAAEVTTGVTPLRRRGAKHPDRTDRIAA